MSVLDEIKAAAAKLDPDQQVELFRWWVDSDGFKQRQLAALKRDLAIGLDQLDRGQYKTYDDTNVMQLAEEISKRGRERFKTTDKNKEA
jgi:hypothetical protein